MNYIIELTTGTEVIFDSKYYSNVVELLKVSANSDVFFEVMDVDGNIHLVHRSKIVQIYS